jgi:menaquinone-dependent protoporphyrinogen oxidase
MDGAVNILVAYTACREPVRPIADHLADSLRQLGAAAYACSAIEPVEVAAYDGIVLGSALRAGRWLPEGRRFAVENSGILRQRPTWLFSVGVEGGRPDLFRSHTAERLLALQRETDQVDTLRHLTDPLDYRYFTANVAGPAWFLRARSMVSVLDGPLRRRGNWTSIDAWARSIVMDVTLRVGASLRVIRARET